ncbi:hypothetical protein Q3G72_008009 [Acer saccharum]|nr:hypothetical protein Q3G72_008009 [Acer saccharum]
MMSPQQLSFDDLDVIMEDDVDHDHEEALNGDEESEQCSRKRNGYRKLEKESHACFPAWGELGIRCLVDLDFQKICDQVVRLLQASSFEHKLKMKFPSLSLCKKLFRELLKYKVDQTPYLQLILSKKTSMRFLLPESDITLYKGMDNYNIAWNAISDVNRALQACSLPGSDIHWTYGEMDKLMFYIPFFSGKIDSSSLPYNREMDIPFDIHFFSGNIDSSFLPPPVIDLDLEP